MIKIKVSIMSGVLTCFQCRPVLTVYSFVRIRYISGGEHKPGNFCPSTNVKIRQLIFRHDVFKSDSCKCCQYLLFSHMIKFQMTQLFCKLRGILFNSIDSGDPCLCKNVEAPEGVVRNKLFKSSWTTSTFWVCKGVTLSTSGNKFKDKHTTSVY